MDFSAQASGHVWSVPLGMVSERVGRPSFGGDHEVAFGRPWADTKPLRTLRPHFGDIRMPIGGQKLNARIDAEGIANNYGKCIRNPNLNK